MTESRSPGDSSSPRRRTCAGRRARRSSCGTSSAASCRSSRRRRTSSGRARCSSSSRRWRARCSPSTPSARARRSATARRRSPALLLGLTLPAGIPMWMAAFGGVRRHRVRQADLRRAGIQRLQSRAVRARVPAGGVSRRRSPRGRRSADTWWALRGDNFALPFMHPRTVDAITAATPLGLMKFEGKGTPLARPLRSATPADRSARPRRC